MDKTPLKHKVSAVVRRHILIKPIRHQRNYFDHEAACLSANTGGRLKIRLLLVAEGAPPKLLTSGQAVGIVGGACV